MGLKKWKELTEKNKSKESRESRSNLEIQKKEGENLAAVLNNFVTFAGQGVDALLKLDACRRE